MKNGRTGRVRSLVLAAIISAASFTTFGQVKVGDDPAIIDGNAVLEVESTNKGVLIPRVLLNDAATIAPLTGGSVTEGMLIYNLGGTEPNGFYYWNGTQWVAFAESITTLADDGNGGYTYTSEDGTQTSFNAPSVNVSNGTGAPTGTGTGGDIYVDDATGNIYTYNGTTGVWENQAENVTTLADNGDGTHTYTSEDGTATTFNTPDGSVSTGTGAPTGTGTGGDIYVDDATGDIYTYNGTSGAWENQAETTTSLVQDTVAGTMTYTDEQGTQNVLDLGALVNNQETTTSLVQDTVAGTMTYTDEQGTQNVLDLGALVNNQETTTSLVQDTVAGTMTYTDEQGTQSVLDLGALVNNQETVTTLVDNGDSTFTYTSEDGMQTTYTDIDTQLTEAQVDAFTANNGYLTSFTEVDGSIANEIQTISNSGNTLSLSNGGGSVIVPEPWFGSDDNNRATSNTETIYTMGRVGIGTNQPNVNFEISDTTSTSIRLTDIDSDGTVHRSFIEGWNGNLNTRQWFVGVTTGGGNMGLVNYGEGSLFIGSNGSIQPIEVDSSGKVGVNGNPTHTLSVNGSASKTGGGSWLTYSDRRVKKNVEPYSKGLEEILKIKPVTFKYNGLGGYDEDGKTYVGVIAQEIEQVLPSTVTQIKTEDFEDQRVYDSSELTYTLINAIKELKKENDELKERLEKIEEMLGL